MATTSQKTLSLTLQVKADYHKEPNQYLAKYLQLILLQAQFNHSKAFKMKMKNLPSHQARKVQRKTSQKNPKQLSSTKSVQQLKPKTKKHPTTKRKLYKKAKKRSKQ